MNDQDLESRMRSAEERIRDLDMVLSYLLSRTYTPADAVLRRACDRLRARGSACADEERGKLPAATSSRRMSPAVVDRATALRSAIIEAAATARTLRTRAEDLIEANAPQDDVDAAIDAADEADRRAAEIAARARTELLGPAATGGGQAEG